MPAKNWRAELARVIASSIRKGNVLEIDGKLCTVLKADNIHPGKGTPVTHLEMRRIHDGVKITERYRTTEQVERAFMEERDFEYIYEDDAGYNFMDPVSFEQLPVPKDIVGEQSVYLQEQMKVVLMLPSFTRRLGIRARMNWRWRQCVTIPGVLRSWARLRWMIRRHDRG